MPQALKSQNYIDFVNQRWDLVLKIFEKIEYCPKEPAPYPWLKGDCIIWDGSINGKGYACYSWRQHTILISRLLFSILFGGFPAEVGHKCDDKLCVNIDHLEATTPLENNRGKVRTGSIRFTSLLVHDIWQHHKQGMKTKDIAKLFHVGAGTIYDILRGRTWPDIHFQETGQMPKG